MDHIPNGTLMVQIINAHISNTSSGPVSPLRLEYTDAVETKLAEQAKKLRCFTKREFIFLIIFLQVFFPAIVFVAPISPLILADESSRGYKMDGPHGSR